MKKVLLPIIIISLILVTIFQSVLSVRAICINEEKDKLLNNKYKDYFNCKIRTSEEAVDGRAILFPGLYYSFGPGITGVNVKRASGILIAFDYIMGHISFNNDKYYADWIKAYVFSFNGYFSNYREGSYPYQVFEMNGTAKFARVYF